ncbi:hypothetical protein ACFRKE_23585 [Kitasatospora indigofera]|uniref:hypothetical protein n=1 Tax=Kitasatospora indigofera TaxID=67307 RepID=UPI0036409E42
MTASSRVRINTGTPAAEPASRVRIKLRPARTGTALRPFSAYLRGVADDLDAGRPVDVAALRSAVDDLAGSLRAEDRAGTGAPTSRPGRS